MILVVLESLDLLEDLGDMLDSGVLDMHCLEQFAHFRSQKLLYFVFKFGLDLINKLLGLSSLLLSFTHLIALHEFHQICKLE